MGLLLIPAIHRATHQIGLSLRQIRGLDVDQGEAHILAHLADHGDTTLAVLHEAFGHRRSTLTSIIDRLTARGFVQRKVEPSDRRSFRICLTAKGRAPAQLVAKSLKALEDRALRGISVPVRKSLVRALAGFTVPPAPG